MVPITSAGSRWGVNWMREKLACRISARVRTASVLASPGTPSRRMCPPVSSPISSRSTIACWPTSRRPTSSITSRSGSEPGGGVAAGGGGGAAGWVIESLFRGVEMDGTVDRAFFLGCQRSPFAHRELAEPDRTVGQPREPVHLEAEGLGPAPHDVLPAFREGDVENAAALHTGTHPHRARHDGPALQHDRALDRLGELRGGAAVHH